METLRIQLIRLAASTPKGSAFRRDLLALLQSKKASSEPETFMSNSQVRVQHWDHPINTIIVQELPGTSGKKQLRKMRYVMKYYALHLSDTFLSINLLEHYSKITLNMNYDQVVAELDKALFAAKEEAMRSKRNPVTEKTFADVGFPRSCRGEETVSALEIPPADYKPIDFKGKNFGGTAKWESFKFWDDRDSLPNSEGMRDFHKSKTSAGARKLFKLLKLKPNAFSNMSMREFMEFLKQNKIGQDWVPSVWR